MSKETNLHTIEGQRIFAENAFFNLMRGLFFQQNTNFKSGGIITGEVHQGESIINKKSLFKSPIPKP